MKKGSITLSKRHVCPTFNKNRLIILSKEQMCSTSYKKCYKPYQRDKHVPIEMAYHINYIPLFIKNGLIILSN